MGEQKVYFPVPSCKECGCPHYVNNHSDNTYVSKANRRTLYRGERYCLYEKRPRQFGKNQSWFRVPAWCPRKLSSPVVRCYSRRANTYFEDMFGHEIIIPVPKDYTLSHITNTFLTPRQLYMKLRNKYVVYGELLAGWYPRQYDVLEIDIGVAQYYLFLSSKGWKQCYKFDAAQCNNGIYGQYMVLAHQNLELNRYTQNSPDYARFCIGIVQGYFAGGVFQRHWIENKPGLAQESFDKELEDLLYTLQTQGFLSSFDSLHEFCWTRCWAWLKDEQKNKRFGFYVEGQLHKYYLVLIPREDSTYNILIYVYSMEGGMDGEM